MDPLEREIEKAMSEGGLPETPAVTFSHSSPDSVQSAPPMVDGESFDSYVDRVFQDMPDGGVVEATSSAAPSGGVSGDNGQMDEIVSLLRDILSAVQNGLSV